MRILLPDCRICQVIQQLDHSVAPEIRTNFFDMNALNMPHHPVVQSHIAEAKVLGRLLLLILHFVYLFLLLVNYRLKALEQFLSDMLVVPLLGSIITFLEHFDYLLLVFDVQFDL